MSESIDLNCDMGESFGLNVIGNDEVLMPLVSSANIACGYHGGDPGTIHRAVRLAQLHDVAIGAHPSYPDLQGFGRRDMGLTSQEDYDIVLYQIGATEAFVRAAGVRLHHVKPHGALYNRAARDLELAEAITHAVYYFDKTLMLYGPAGSALEQAALVTGLTFCREVFADRTYRSDGSLTPRSDVGAVIREVGQCVRQVEEILTTGMVTTIDGSLIPMTADTICVHGDGSHAVEFATALRKALTDHGIRICAPIVAA